MRRLFLTAIPAALTLAACGGAQDITTTESNNVVLNEAHSTVAFSNDGEVPANELIIANGTAMNEAEANATMPAGNAM